MNKLMRKIRFNIKYLCEFCELCKYKKIPLNKIWFAWKLNKNFAGLPLGAPCEDCDNCNCKNLCTRVLWCKDQR